MVRTDPKGGVKWLYTPGYMNTAFEAIRLASDGSLVAGGRSDSTAFSGTDFLLQRFAPGSTGIEDDQIQDAGSVVLQPPTPNPFSSSTTLRLTLPGAGGVSALVFDLGGRVVATFADDAFPAGESLLVWDGRDACGRQVGEGIYYAVVRAGGSTMVRRMVLLR